MKKHVYPATLLCALLAGSAQADDATTIAEARKCTSIEGAGLRMTCYDAVFKGDGKATLPTPNHSADVALSSNDTGRTQGKWQQSHEKSAMTDQDSYVLSVTSDQPVMCKQYGDASYVTLYIRCMEDTTAVFVSGDCYLTSGFQGYGQVTARLDQGAPAEYAMDASSDNSALGFWSGSKAIPFIKSMIGKDKLITRFYPFGSSSIEPTFQITGLDGSLGPLRETCGW